MVPDSPRSEQANADVLLWQTGYRVSLALLGSVVAVTLRTAGVLSLSPVAAVTIGRDAADWMLGLVSVLYVILVMAIRSRVRRTRRAGRTMSTLMVVADLAVVFWLVFLLADARDYHRALLVALFSLQLTHVYFGRAPAMLMLLAIAASYLLLVDIAIRHAGDVTWAEALITLGIFGVGAMLVTIVQSNLHQRLATLVTIFERAEDGDFTNEYDVSADARPDALTVVGRAYNRMRTQLASIVLNDPLSGCANRRGFEQHYRRELARAARTSTDLALVSIDLDHFKQINDTYGHLTGDRVIVETGELLRANARAGDLVARTGGEEFVILAPNTSMAGAQHLALRIVEAFRRRTFGEPDERIAVTVSIGVVADVVTNEDIAEDLRARADEALYAAKRSGRNRVVLWSHGLDALRLGQPGDDAVPPKPASVLTERA
ncbi:MAG: GGDEF domain-containing protein [Gemmatimonadaceae bacterium]|nr:GGDEF domain-containing protein [Gemmatimonadaceae bacterium]